MPQLSDYAAHHPLGVLIFLAFVGVLLVALRGYGGGAGPPQPVAKAFLTPRELAMQDALERVLPMYRIHAQVAMGALLKTPARLGRRASPSDRNSFAQKIVDFPVFDTSTGTVVALIELGDRSHDAEKDRARDRMTRVQATRRSAYRRPPGQRSLPRVQRSPICSLMRVSRPRRSHSDSSTASRHALLIPSY